MYNDEQMAASEPHGPLIEPLGKPALMKQPKFIQLFYNVSSVIIYFAKNSP